MNLKGSPLKININWSIVKSIVRRDLRIYFTNPTGYVFITLFIFLSAAGAFWQERFFLNNLANLNELNQVFPLLLIFFIPALTMGVWADEKKQGTDELLFTLPATDLEVVLGKYLATVGIYSASLVLAFVSHIVILVWLGSPDLGLIIGNYIGYWFSGSALIAVGMLASLLTANVTISFILGALFTSFFVFVDTIGKLVSRGVQDVLSPLGIVDHFTSFASGIVSFSAMLYFISIAGLALYINVLLIGRRHWPAQADGYKMSHHHLVRSIALVIALIAFNVILSRIGFRQDVTAEQLHSLSAETRHLLDDIPNERPVFIEAFVSKEVPQQYVQTRANLIGFLEEMDAIGGPRVEVIIHDTEPFTQDARDAREKFNITPQDIPDVSSARASTLPTFMGVAFKSGAEEQVIPFFDRGLPVEYELARSIRVVAKTARKKIGILTTEAKLFGGFDFQSFRSTPPWPVVEELKKQYEVVQVSAASPIEEKMDGLLVALPSSLPQPEMDNLEKYILKGNSTLLLVDPLPITNIGLAPSEKAGANTNPFMRNQGPPPKDKGDIQRLLTNIGFGWNKAQIVWDVYNPHPDMAQLQPEIVFAGEGNNNPDVFNEKNRSSANLQEVVFLFPGYLQKAASSSFEFTPLVETGEQSGSLNYQQLVQRSFFGTQLVNPRFGRRPNSLTYTLAAQVKGQEASKDSTVDGKAVDAITIADLDFISQEFFEIRKRAVGNLNFDNVTFFLNCMDVLVGDESFISLRNKRVRHRTLETVEAQTRRYIDQRNQEEQDAESVASRALAEAQQRLNEKVAEVRQRADLDEQTKQIMARNLQEAENRKFEAMKANIEAEKDAKIASSKERMEEKIRNIEGGIKTFAVLLPPIPVFIMGVWIFVQRQKREREGERAARRLRS